jgi:primosomal protein N' (replication factor Y) (superfamily II helicase)
MAITAGPVRVRHALNPAQQSAYEQIADAIAARRYQTFLLHGVTGSGKTEVYLNCIEAALAEGPQRPAAGAGDRAHSRHGRPILRALRRPRRHPAQRLHRRGTLRAVAPHPLRRGVGRRRHALGRLRAGAQSRADRGRRGARRLPTSRKKSALQRPRRGHRARAGGRRVRGARLGHAQPGEPLQRRARKIHPARTARPHRGAAHALGGADRHAAGVSGDAPAGHFLAQAPRGHRRAPRERRADHRAAQSPRIFEFRRLPFLRRARQCVNCSLTLTYHKRDRRLLCHYCGYAEKIPSVCPKCQSEHIYFLGWGPKKSRRICTAPSPPPASPASTATPSPASASTRPSSTNSARAITTSSWARR